MPFLEKRRLFGVFIILGALYLSVGLFWACDDFGVTADFVCCNIRGEITLSQAVPENTDEIRVAVSKEFPPADILSLIFTGVLPLNRDTTVTSQTIPFNLSIPRGEYAAVFAIWKEKDESFSPTDRIGLFADETGGPIPITIANEDTTVSDVNIPIDFAPVDKTAKIEGTITYVNNGTPITSDQWPSNTGIIALGALREIAPSFRENNFVVRDINSTPNRFTINEFELVLAFDFALPLNVERFDYRLRTPKGDVKLVALFWLPEGSPLEVINRIQVLGIYRNPDAPDGLAPGQFSIDDNQTVTGIDIVADFGDCVECGQ